MKADAKADLLHGKSLCNQILSFRQAALRNTSVKADAYFPVMADEGQVIIEKLVERLNLPHVVAQLRKLEEYGLENEQKYPWMPSAWNKSH